MLAFVKKTYYSINSLLTAKIVKLTFLSIWPGSLIYGFNQQQIFEQHIFKHFKSKALIS